ncbi:SH3 domain-containing C40 family peptidase [Exiguobacterium sp. s189]|uniref:C40 family peptidase n=1 Tax=Exiguobacterium sp. s189 TaxID=2751263 RepID=UPI0020366BF7|nr:SH3 domain-containing C40 family peptidase [Exiguobacterium sp. s189]
MLKRIASIVVAATVAFSGLMFSTGEQAEAASSTSVYSKVNSLNIRTAASLTSSKVVGKMNRGQSYQYLGKSGSFYKINYKGSTRYVSASSKYTYTKSKKTTVSKTSTTSSKKYSTVKSKVNSLNIRSKASLKSSVVGKMNNGQSYKYLGKSGSFYKIEYKGKTRYVSASSKYTSLSSSTATTKATASKGSTDARSKLVAESKKYLGTPYRYGGTTTSGFDCSGYTGYVYKKAIGKTLPRSSRQQYSSAKKISKSSIQAGDLVFFSHSGGTIQHVGMALSKTQMINSETGGVKYASFTSGYWAPRYVGAGSYL